jgi:hypothetical protein
MTLTTSSGIPSGHSMQRGRSLSLTSTSLSIFSSDTFNELPSSLFIYIFGLVAIYLGLRAWFFVHCTFYGVSRGVRMRWLGFGFGFVIVTSWSGWYLVICVLLHVVRVMSLLSSVFSEQAARELRVRLSLLKLNVLRRKSTHERGVSK